MKECLKKRIRDLYSLEEEESGLKNFISEWQTSEQIIVPILYCIGWPILPKRGIRLIRTGASKDFDLLYFNANTQEICMGVECKNFAITRSAKIEVHSGGSPSNDSFSEQIIRYWKDGNIVKKGKYKFRDDAKFVWTNGKEWVVFKRPAMERREDEKEIISKLFAIKEDEEEEHNEGYDYNDYFENFKFKKDKEDEWDEQFEKLSRELTIP